MNKTKKSELVNPVINPIHFKNIFDWLEKNTDKENDLVPIKFNNSLTSSYLKKIVKAIKLKNDSGMNVLVFTDIELLAITFILYSYGIDVTKNPIFVENPLHNKKKLEPEE